MKEIEEEAAPAPAPTPTPTPTPSPDPTPSPSPTPTPRARKAVDLGAAKVVFEAECAKYHELEDVDKEPPRSARQVDAVIERMVENGMEVGRKELVLIR